MLSNNDSGIQSTVKLPHMTTFSNSDQRLSAGRCAMMSRRVHLTPARVSGSHSFAYSCWDDFDLASSLVLIVLEFEKFVKRVSSPVRQCNFLSSSFSAALLDATIASCHVLSFTAWRSKMRWLQVHMWCCTRGQRQRAFKLFWMTKTQINITITEEKETRNIPEDNSERIELCFSDDFVVDTIWCRPYNFAKKKNKVCDFRSEWITIYESWIVFFK